MKKLLFYTFLSFSTYNCFSQLVINGAAVININAGTMAKPSYVVLNNPPATPITTIGTTGGIMMESEYNITKYNIGSSSTPITVPYFSKYTSVAGVQFPLAVTGISGGIVSSNGNMQFSSKLPSVAFGSGFDNVNYMPSDVLNMNGWNANIFTANNSPRAIDRFWIVDAIGYSTTPAVTYDFGYISAEGNANGGNTFVVANLLAEPFDKVAGSWAGSPTGAGPVGVNTTGATEGNVSGVSLAAGIIGTKYRSWTLVDKLNPLPVELLLFKDSCINGFTRLTWATASESNSANFTVEKSNDAINFFPIGNIPAAVNSLQTKQYSFTDFSVNTHVTYYRLVETDLNGATTVFKIISAMPCNSNMVAGSQHESANVFTADNQSVNVVLQSNADQAVNITIYDVTGRLIYKDILTAIQGSNRYVINQSLANATYLVELQTLQTVLVKKILINK